MEGKTGFVAKAHSRDDWFAKIHHVLSLMEQFPALYRKMCQDARSNVLENYRWENALAGLFDEEAFSAVQTLEKKIA